MNLADLITGAAAVPIPPGAVTVHRIATDEELAEDDDTPRACGCCGVPKPRDDYYTKPDGRRYTVCKACVVKQQLRLDQAKRARQ